MRLRGILFFGLECPDGFYVRMNDAVCAKCEPNCLRCDATQCLQRQNNFIVDTTDMISCKFDVVLPPSFNECLYYQEIAGLFKCIYCNEFKKYTTSSQIDGCQCR